jgi:ankyrin repeat protein
MFAKLGAAVSLVGKIIGGDGAPEEVSQPPVPPIPTINGMTTEELKAIIEDANRLGELQAWLQANSVDFSSLLIGPWLRPLRPLQVAIAGQNPGAVRLLLQNGAPPDGLAPPNKTTPLYSALFASFNYDATEIITILRQHGARRVHNFSESDRERLAGEVDSLATLIDDTSRFVPKIQQSQAANLRALIAPLDGCVPIANLNHPCDDAGNTFLHMLARNGSEAYWDCYFPILRHAEILIQLYQVNAAGDSPLHLAAQNIKSASHIISQLATIAKEELTQEAYRGYIFSLNTAGFRPIDHAIQSNNIPAFTTLLDLMVAEFEACKTAQSSVDATIVLSDNFNLLSNFQNGQHKTIFDLALEHDNPEFLNELISRHLIGPFANGNTVFHRLLSRGSRADLGKQVEMVCRQLQKAYPEQDLSTLVNQKNDAGFTPLAQYMKEYWQTIEGKSSTSTTPNSSKREKEVIALLEIMVRNGADLNGEDESGQSLLYHALANKQQKLAEWLLAQSKAENFNFCAHCVPPLLHLAAKQKEVWFFTALHQRNLTDQNFATKLIPAMNVEYRDPEKLNALHTPLDYVTRREHDLPVYDDDYLTVLQCGGDHAGPRKAFHEFITWVLKVPQRQELSALQKRVMITILRHNPDAFLQCDEEEKSALSRVIAIQHTGLIKLFLPCAPDELTPFSTLRLLLTYANDPEQKQKYLHTLAPALAHCEPRLTTKLLVMSVLATLLGIALLSFGAAVLLSGGLGITLLPFIVPAMTQLNLILGIATCVIGAALAVGGTVGLVKQIPQYRIYSQAEKLIKEFNTTELTPFASETTTVSQPHIN